MTEPSSFGQPQRLILPNANDNLSTQQTSANFKEIQRWGNNLLATKGWTTGGVIAFSANGVQGIGGQINKNGTYPLMTFAYMMPSSSSSFTSPVTIKAQTEQNSTFSSSISLSNPLEFQLASGYYYKLYWTFLMSFPTVPLEKVSSLVGTQLPSFKVTFQLTNLPIKTADPTSYDIVGGNIIYDINGNASAFSTEETYYCEQYGVTNSQLGAPNIIVTNYFNPYDGLYANQFQQSFMDMAGTLTIYYIPQTRKNGNI